MLGQEVVVALYRALLGHPPDAEGLAYWRETESVDALVDALRATPRYAERALALAGAGEVDRAPADQAAARILASRGLTELADPVPGPGVHHALEGFPWGLLDLRPGSRVRVVGRYAPELADELGDRERGTQVVAGLDDRVPAPQMDVLVITAGGDLAALRRVRPDVLRAVRDAVVVPSVVDPTRPADETAPGRARLRDALHELGFTEVRVAHRPRHGATATVLATTLATPTPGRLLGDGDSADLPAVTWLLARRVATETDR
ncbi:hypothetical protein [Cellulomonas sp. PS-H5]|uniref:hypothetical protein n=1 Tax=Cellulomonas sp. PS-H5 TaxID=2820400 RepID=UPI001C4F9733|nr:hypothetical protein [Cellulomonas sp. PS-H5]MBW0255540.1 hypothetical protein [Cellulomonas sp. PS-H5]